MRQISATERFSGLFAVVAVVAVLGLIHDAAAQDAPGPPVGAVLPAAAFGSTVAAMIGLQSRAGGEAPERRAITGTAWLICDPAAEDCAGLEPHAISMQTMPRWDLRISLPRDFELRGHMWTMTHEDVDVSMRQAIVGGTLRHRAAGRWAEIGVGFAERAIDAGDEYEGKRRGPFDDDAGEGRSAVARAAIERLGPALLAGVGVSIVAGRHARFDLRLRGGLGVGDGAEGVYHCHLGVAFVWR